jgi:predicted AAA+ superfamily ATPase
LKTVKEKDFFKSKIIVMLGARQVGKSSEDVLVFCWQFAHAHFILKIHWFAKNALTNVLILRIMKT